MKFEVLFKISPLETKMHNDHALAMTAIVEYAGNLGYRLLNCRIVVTEQEVQSAIFRFSFLSYVHKAKKPRALSLRVNSVFSLK